MLLLAYQEWEVQQLSLARGCSNGLHEHIWNKTDVIKMSEEETKFLTECDDVNDDNVVLEKPFHLNLKLWLVTEGSNGCRSHTEFMEVSEGGAVKVNCVDTTVAGEAFDAFVDGILKSLASDRDLMRHIIHFCTAFK